MCASTTFHSFVLIPFSLVTPAAASTHLQSMVKSFQTLCISQDPETKLLAGLSHVTQARSDVWVVVDEKLYDLFHQVWGGMKPQFTELTPSYAALQKQQLLYLHLERTGAGEAESRLEASSRLQWQLRSCHPCHRCEGKVFSSNWHQGIEGFSATFLQADF